MWECDENYAKLETNHETSKEPLPDDDESGNEVDSESEAGMPAILMGEPIIACFNNP